MKHLPSKSILTKSLVLLNLALAIPLANSCGTEQLEPENPEDANGSSAVGGTARKPVPSTDIATPFKAVRSIAAQLVATGANTSTSLGTDGQALALDEDNICDDYGFPTNNAMPYEGGGNQDWVAHKTYCILTKDSGTSETIQGTLSTLKLFTCLLHDDVVFDGIERAASLPLTAECMDPADISQLHQEGIASFDVLTKGNTLTPEGGKHWQHELVLSVDPTSDLARQLPAGFQFTLRYVDVPGSETAFAALMESEAHTKDEAVAARVDYNSGTLFFEYRSPRYHANSDGNNTSESWSRHIRLKAKGSFKDQLTLDVLDELDSIYSELSTGQDKESPLDDQLTIATVSGKKTSGFKTSLQYATGSALQPSTLSGPAATSIEKCYIEPNGTGCTQILAHRITTTQDLGFVLHPDHDDFINAKTFFESTSSYLNYDMISFQD